MTGWNLPPGCSCADIDRAVGVDMPCLVCGQPVDKCICPECGVCGTMGDPTCYEKHGMTRSDDQIASLAAAEAIWKAEAQAEAMALTEERHYDEDCL